MTDPPRIAVVGCGALGGYYGAHLARAGFGVHLLLRSDHARVREHGLRIVNAAGGFTVHPFAARDPFEIGHCDLVLVGLKATANRELARLLPPLVGGTTAVLTLQNGLGNEELIATIVGPGRVLGGLCFVCLNRIAPGVVRHLAHGRIVMGELGRPASARTHQIADLFRRSGIPCTVTDDLNRAHWEKLVWNVPFNGLGVAAVAGLPSVLAGRVLDWQRLGSCHATDQLLNDPQWLGLVRELMREIITAARALGLALPDAAVDEQVDRTRDMGAYRASTLIDFEQGLPLELESLFGEPLRRARGAGAHTPRLAALYQVLQELDARRSATGNARDPESPR